MLDHAPKPKRDYSRALAALELLAVELRLTVAERVELERRLIARGHDEARGTLQGRRGFVDARSLPG